MSKREALAEKKLRKEEDPKNSEEQEEESSSSKPKKSVNRDGYDYWCLSNNKRVSVGSFKGKVNVNLREYFEKDGDWFPTKKGLTLSLEQWEYLKQLVQDIDKSISSKQGKN